MLGIREVPACRPQGMGLSPISGFRNRSVAPNQYQHTTCTREIKLSDNRSLTKLRLAVELLKQE